MALHTSAIVSRKLSDILTHVSRINLAFPGHVPLFTLSVSSSIEQSQMQDLATRLSTLSPHAVGCLSAPIPSSSEALRAGVACSLAVFHKDNTIAFRSEIPGRNAPQVGRWHAFRKKDQDPKGFGTGAAAQTDADDVNWEDVWAKHVDVPPLPSELQSIQCVFAFLHRRV